MNYFEMKKCPSPRRLRRLDSRAFGAYPHYFDKSNTGYVSFLNIRRIGWILQCRNVD